MRECPEIIALSTRARGYAEQGLYNDLMRVNGSGSIHWISFSRFISYQVNIL
jgi:hypothetical protein